MCQRCPVDSCQELCLCLVASGQNSEPDTSGIKSYRHLSRLGETNFFDRQKKDGLRELHDSTLVGLTLPPIAHPGLLT